MRADRPRAVQLFGQLVDGDDVNVVVRQRGEHRRHAHTAEPDDDDRLARPGSPTLSTAPPPVSTAQPSTEATSGGTSESTGTTDARSTTAWVAKPETPR